VIAGTPTVPRPVGTPPVARRSARPADDIAAAWKGVSIIGITSARIARA
jgi:hypothetical protein